MRRPAPSNAAPSRRIPLRRATTRTKMKRHPGASRTVRQQILTKAIPQINFKIKHLTFRTKME
jgi:hypothetical protein